MLLFLSTFFFFILTDIKQNNHFPVEDYGQMNVCVSSKHMEVKTKGSKPTCKKAPSWGQ